MIANTKLMRLPAAALLLAVCQAAEVASGPVPVKPMAANALELLPPGSVRLSGSIQERIAQQAALAFDATTLAEMADIFRARRNGFAAGEYWGKTVRALRHFYQYNGDSNIADQFELTMFNALLGSIRPDGQTVDYHTHLSGTKPAKGRLVIVTLRYERRQGNATRRMSRYSLRFPMSPRGGSNCACRFPA